MGKIKYFNDTGRIIHVEIITETDHLQILGIYQGHTTTEKDTIYINVKRWLNENEGYQKITLGDFNEIASELDYSAEYVQARRPKGRLHSIMERQGMSDIVCSRNPTQMEHTRVGSTIENKKSFSRLDYIYCNNKILEKIVYSKTLYNSQIILDHMPIMTSVLMKTVISAEG
jgi:exonuclease III